jgi:hypothetical protein
MAGGQDKILWSLSLEGAEEVSKKLKATGDVGDEQAKRLKQAFDGVSAGKGGEGFGGLGGKSEESRVAAERLREALHTLHPILDTAGLGLGNLGAFARVAGAGFGAFGAAIVGSIVVGLAKMAEQADRTGARLKALSGSDNAFKTLSGQAKALGVDVGDLAPNFEKLVQYGRQLRADQNQAGGITHPPGYTPGPAEEAASKVQIFSGKQAFPGGIPSDQSLAAFHQALIEGSRIDRTPKSEALGGIGSLLDSILKSGEVKAGDVTGLQKVSPSLAQEVAKALSGSSANGGLGRNFANPKS